MKDDIPEQFYKGDSKPFCLTVGDLIDELRKLPLNLPVRQGLNDGCILTVYNVSSDNSFLKIEDNDEA